MDRALLCLLKYIDNLSVFVGKTAAWLVIPILLLQAYEPILRLFGGVTIWTWEVAMMTAGVHFLLGGAWVMQQNKHVRADVLSRKLPVRVRAVLDIIMHATVFAVLMYVLVPVSWGHALRSFVTNEGTSTEWSPLFYHFKTAMAVAFTLIALQGFANTLRALRFLITGHTGRDDETYLVAPLSPCQPGDASCPSK